MYFDSERVWFKNEEIPWMKKPSTGVESFIYRPDQKVIGSNVWSRSKN